MTRFRFVRLLPRRLALRVLCCLLGGLAVMAARAVPLEVVTTDYPPFSYTDAKVPRGLGTEILQAIAASAGFEPHIVFLPWQRALRQVEQRPDTLIYTLARTPERERRYEWIGPFASRKVYFWKLRSRSDVKVSSLQDVHRFKVATVREDAQTELMTSKGLVNASKDFFLTSDDSVLRMLIARHADLVANSEIGMAWRLRELGFDPDLVERGPLLVEGGGYYFAFGKGADPARVASLRSAYERAQAAGTIDRLRERYQPDCVTRSAGCALPAVAP
jgi:polar amino acid transport system substrate-binding protein